MNATHDKAWLIWGLIPFLVLVWLAGSGPAQLRRSTRTTRDQPRVSGTQQPNLSTTEPNRTPTRESPRLPSRQPNLQPNLPLNRKPDRQPGGETPRVPSHPQGDLNWQGVLGGLLRDEGSEERRPGPIIVPPRPDYRPPRPDYHPPRPDYIPNPNIRPVPIIPDRTIIEPRVNLRPVFPETNVVPAVPENIVTPSHVAIPRQPSPLQGKVWEVSGREAVCYSGTLARLVDQTLTDSLKLLGKGEPKLLELQAKVEELRQMMSSGASWRDLEPLSKKLLEEHRATLGEQALAKLEYAIQMLMVRDSFRLVMEAEPRGRGSAFSVEAIPVGVIWIIYDPTLALGTALFVNEHVLICGTAGGELLIARGTAAAALGLPVGAGPPVPDADLKTITAQRGAISIHHQEDAATPVNYVLNRRQSFTIQAGQTQSLAADQRWVIEFDRGGGKGTATYDLTKGYYEFTVVEDHWELFKLNFEVTIDNRDGKEDFVYVMNNEVITVPAGKTQKHEEKEPVVVEFDRGAGPESPARKNLNKNGTYKVAVNTDNNYLDLFPDQKAEDQNKAS